MYTTLLVDALGGEAMEGVVWAGRVPIAGTIVVVIIICMCEPLLQWFSQWSWCYMCWRLPLSFRHDACVTFDLIQLMDGNCLYVWFDQVGFVSVWF